LAADGYSVESFQLDIENIRPPLCHPPVAGVTAHPDWTPAASAVLEQLRHRLAREIARLPLGQAPAHAPRHALVSLILALPQQPNAIAQLPGAQFQLLHPDGEGLRAGYGVAAEWQAEGPDRLTTLAAVARDWPGLWQQQDPDGTGLRAFALLGFAAAPDPLPPREDQLPNALLWVPDIGLRQSHGQAALVFNAPQSQSRASVQARWNERLEELVPRLFAPPRRPALVTELRADFAEPEREDWTRLVEQALARIAAGELQKVVLSRRLQVSGSRAFDLDRLLDVLSTIFPSCQIVNLRRDGSNFVAATPERLLQLDGRQLAVDAIAGTAGRSECDDRDQRLGEELLCCEKNLREHDFVVDAVRQALTPCCRAIQVPRHPSLMRLRNAQHLWSPITGEAEPRVDLFDLAGQLHPTPATNGEPRHAAHQWLRRHEPFSREWYTGVAGFIEPGKGAALWVLLRCARLQAARAELYAGAGIVAGSDPAAEWEETEAKLAAMLTALRFA
jgi:menaquinone-specific isochorismate synthase